MHNPRSDTYTNVTYRQNPSFCERVQQSLVAVIIGVLLIVVASVLLFWNEVSEGEVFYVYSEDFS